MNHTLLKKLFLLILLLSASVTHADTDTLNTLKECRMRGGLPNFFDKLKAGKNLVIAYFGGSITAAAGGWRDQSMAWFKAAYPKAEISQINAGVGGTGSDLGAFRLKNDALQYHPDLVFVEFAVNDGGGGDRVHKTMEGIVRQIWKANPETDICFVYTVAGNMLTVLNQGKLWPSMLAMEHVAEHYRIPSVQFAPAVLELLNAGKAVFAGKPAENPGKLVLTGDNIHPLAVTGHRIYTEALIRSMKLMQRHSGKLKHVLLKPYSADNWEDAQMISINALKKTGEWQQLTDADTIARSYRHRFPVLYRSVVPGSSLRLKFIGRMAGIYDMVGPGCGQYAVNIDGRPDKLYPRFDRHSTYYRSHYFFADTLKNSEHSIVWKVSAEKLDKMTILQKSDQPAGDPKKYKDNACYVGWLMLLGKLIE